MFDVAEPPIGASLSAFSEESGTRSQPAAALARNLDVSWPEQFSVPRRLGSTAKKQTQTILTDEKATEAREICVTLARQARDSFSIACSSESLCQTEAAFSSSKRLLDELWDFAYLRDRPFRDLLALLDAALKRADLFIFDAAQREALTRAFAALPRWGLDSDTVEAHILVFADLDIDITGPLRTVRGKKVRFKIELVED